MSKIKELIEQARNKATIKSLENDTPKDYQFNTNFGSEEISTDTTKGWNGEITEKMLSDNNISVSASQEKLNRRDYWDLKSRKHSTYVILGNELFRKLS